MLVADLSRLAIWLAGPNSFLCDATASMTPSSQEKVPPMLDLLMSGSVASTRSVLRLSMRRTAYQSSLETGAINSV